MLQDGNNKKYVKLQNWWKTHKNSKKKEPNDMVPITYEDRTSKELLTNSILLPSTAEGRVWRSELNNWKMGQTPEKKFGY